MLKVNVITDRYEMSHGCMPSGAGLWLFEDHGYNIVSEFNGPYVAARQHAIKIATRYALEEIWVCP
jgi:hypothetical protein